jgi:hypothetical protein
MAETAIERGGDRRTWATVSAKFASALAAGRRLAAGKFSGTSRQGGDHDHEVSILMVTLDADGR